MLALSAPAGTARRGLGRVAWCAHLAMSCDRIKAALLEVVASPSVTVQTFLPGVPLSDAPSSVERMTFGELAPKYVAALVQESLSRALREMPPLGVCLFVCLLVC